MSRIPPYHKGHLGGEFPFEQSVPADDLPSTDLQPLLDASYEIASQSRLVGQPFRLHPTPALRTILPSRNRTFVAADMNLPGWEKCQDLTQNMLDKVKVVSRPAQ